MKKIFLIVAGLSLGVATTSCSLEKFPDTMYAENNTSGTGNAETAINTRELLEGQLTAMYNYMKGDLQTYWYQLITLAESRADNAYGAANEAKTMTIEQNLIDSDNEFASNLWNYSMNAVDYANQVICNIDVVMENDPALTEKEYFARGSTALLDAVGGAIDHVDLVQRVQPAGYEADKVLFVITTDGMENVSSRYSYREVKRLIERQREKGWEFIFIGANIDVAREAERLGIDRDCAVGYVHDEAGTNVMYRAASCAARMVRCSEPLEAGVWRRELDEDVRRRGR